MQTFVNTSYLRFVKRLYVALHTTLVVLILLGSGALYVAFRPDGLQLINAYLLQPLGIHYAYSTGSLIEGFTLYDLHSDHLKVKKLSLNYRLESILMGKHVIERLEIEGLRIHLDDFKDSTDTIWPFPVFHVREMKLTNLQLIGSYPIEMNLHGRNGHYDGDTLSFRTLDATFKSAYADGAIRGKVDRNTLSGYAILYPNTQKLPNLSGRTLPPKLLLSIQELSAYRARMQTRLDTLSFDDNGTFRASDISLALDYTYDKGYLDLVAHYDLEHDASKLKLHQTLRYALDHSAHTEIKGEVLKSPYPLPSHHFEAEAMIWAGGIKGSLGIAGTHLRISSHDYDTFEWHIVSRHDNLNFIPELSEIFRSSHFRLGGEGTYRLENNDLQGKLQWDHAQGNFEGSFSSYEGVHQLDGWVHLPAKGVLKTQKVLPLPDRMHLLLFAESDHMTLNLSGEELALSLSSRNGRLEGFGNLYHTAFTLTGEYQSDMLSVDIHTHTPSLLETVSALYPIRFEKGEWFDGEVHTHTQLNYDSALRVSGSVSIPWYALTLDSQRSYGGVENSLTYRMEGEKITIDHYRADVVNHILTSPKQGHLHVTPDHHMVIDEWWIYDTLRLTGQIGMNDLSAWLHLHSDRFTYEGPEGKAHARVDVTLKRDSAAFHTLEGDVLIHDALITYLPLQQFKVKDDDIIIVQDVRPPSDTKMRMNLHVSSAQPILFKTKELNLHLEPDLTFWQDPQAPIQILGLVAISSGEVKTSGKTFVLSPSHLYFGGEVPLNPYLDFTLSHEVDYKKLLIYITHRLDSPIFLFASDPVMSQNDIMSYLLFGSPANARLNSDRSTTTARADATNFMLGAGLKELIGGATKIQLDTMNILTNEKGGMGFEVGTHINKDLRILYKNNTVSSILVQYRLNRWLRLDADVHELGQGINAIYVKDFRDFLPHNELKK